MGSEALSATQIAFVLSGTHRNVTRLHTVYCNWQVTRSSAENRFSDFYFIMLFELFNLNNCNLITDQWWKRTK